MARSFIDADSFYDLDEVKDYAERNYKCLTDMGIQINESVDDVVEELMMCPEDMLLDADGYLMTGYVMSSISAPQLFAFDMEGTSYSELLIAVENLSNGEIHIENVLQERDDLAEHGIRISFTCNGEKRSFVPGCDFDWLDVTILGLINEELKQKGSDNCVIFGQSFQMCYITFQTEKWMNDINRMIPAKLCVL